jgi:large subunit ribosomal protein L15
VEQHELRQAPGARHAKKRVGRGQASGQGTYAGRGRKGQKARNNVRAQFEGGQMSIVRRLGHKRGFRNFARIEFRAVALRDLAKHFAAGASVDAEALAAVGLIDNAQTPFKILASGELTHALSVNAPRLSEAAKAAITAAGGSFEETAAAEHRVRNRIHRRKAAAAAALGAPAQGE